MNHDLLKILIVDDELFLRQSFTDFFEDKQFSTVEAENGEKAAEILAGESVDAAIVDIRMEKMNGDIFIRESSFKYPEMAFIICTGSPDYQISGDILKLKNVSDIIFRKPVTNMNSITEEIYRILERIREETDHR